MMSKVNQMLFPPENHFTARKKEPSGNRQHEAERNRRAKENHAIVQLSFIVGSFAIGYVPNTRNNTS